MLRERDSNDYPLSLGYHVGWITAFRFLLSSSSDDYDDAQQSILYHVDSESGQS